MGVNCRRLHHNIEAGNASSKQIQPEDEVSVDTYYRRLSSYTSLLRLVACLSSCTSLLRLVACLCSYTSLLRLVAFELRYTFKEQVMMTITVPDI